MVGERRGEPRRAGPTEPRHAPPSGRAAPSSGSRTWRCRARAATASPSGARRSSIRPGEIVGIAAVEGNGQRELLRAWPAGCIPLRGPSRGRRAGGLHPGRPHDGGPDPRADADRERRPRRRARTTLDPEGPARLEGGARAHGALLKEYDVVAPGPDAPAAALSGGNQQKVVVARELARAPRVIVAENPTRGLDIRATGRDSRAAPRGSRGRCRGAGLLERPRRGAGARAPRARRRAGRCS